MSSSSPATTLGTVRILDTGLTFDQHGDHVDIEKGEVRLLDLAITGTRPSHIVAYAGTAAVFYDGVRASGSSTAVNAKAAAIDIASLQQSSPKLRTIDTAGPQHGLAVALGNDLFAITTPNPAYATSQPGVSSRPLGIVVRAAASGQTIAAFDGSVSGNLACPQLHGHAAVRGVHIFGCDPAELSQQRTGVLILQQAGKRWKTATRAYPDDRRVSTLRSLDKSPFAIGNYGSSGATFTALIRVDTRSKAARTIRRFHNSRCASRLPVCVFRSRVHCQPDARWQASCLPRPSHLAERCALRRSFRFRLRIQREGHQALAGNSEWPGFHQRSRWKAYPRIRSRHEKAGPRHPDRTVRPVILPPRIERSSSKVPSADLIRG